MKRRHIEKTETTEGRGWFLMKLCTAGSTRAASSCATIFCTPPTTLPCSPGNSCWAQCSSCVNQCNSSSKNNDRWLGREESEGEDDEEETEVEEDAEEAEEADEADEAEGREMVDTTGTKSSLLLRSVK